MPTKRQTLGRWGEALAAEYLTKKGYMVIERNLHTPYGEIDLIAKTEDMILFVEVKTRSGDQYGFPEEAITSNKRTHLIAAAQAYLQDNSQLDMDWRIDVIANRKLKASETPEIIHFENGIY
jgi:putative endonuclease